MAGITGPALEQEHGGLTAQRNLISLHHPDRGMSAVLHAHKWCVNAAHSRLANFETKIEIGMRDRRVDGIELADAEEIFPAHGQAGRGQSGDSAHRLGKIDVIG